MNKYKRFTKIADCVTEISKSLSGMGVFDASSISKCLSALVPEDYQRVKTALFPSFYYPYGGFNSSASNPVNLNWGKPWDPSSPVPQNPYRQQPPYGAQQSQSSIDDMFKCMDEEESDIEDATNFVNAIKQFLPTGHIKNDMGIMGEIVNAVREKDFVKAANIVKQSWVEEGQPNIWCPSDINNDKKPWGVWGESDPHFDPYEPRESVDEPRDDNNEDITD
jgi:hypothetical protein